MQTYLLDTDDGTVEITGVRLGEIFLVDNVLWQSYTYQVYQTKNGFCVWFQWAGDGDFEAHLCTCSTHEALNDTLREMMFQLFSRLFRKHLLNFHLEGHLTLSDDSSATL